MEQDAVIQMINHALSDKKAEDIVTLHVGAVSPVCDYFIIASGSNRNQIQALCDNVEEAMAKSGISLKNREGDANGGWILLDYYDIIIHIFTEEMRHFYDLERTWRDAGIIKR